MTTWRATFVAIRILAAYLFVTGLAAGIRQVDFFIDHFGAGRYYEIAAAAVPLVAAVVLWSLADRVAFWLTRPLEGSEGLADADEEVEPARGWQFGDVLTAGVALIGILLAVEAVTSLFYDIGNLVAPIRFAGFGAPAGNPYFRQNVFATIAAAVKLVVSITLIAGSKRVAEFVQRLRYSQETLPRERANDRDCRDHT